MNERERKIEAAYVAEASEEPSLLEKVLQGGDWGGAARLVALLVSLFAIAFSLFHIYTAGYGILGSSWLHRAMHVAGVLILVFTLKPARGKRFHPLLDGLPLLLAVVVAGYMITQSLDIQMREGRTALPDRVVGSALILLIVEATRRTCGWPIALLTSVFIGYIFAGPHLPGLLGHPGFSYNRTISQMFNSTNGIFSAPIYVSSTVLVLFIIFGALLTRSGLGSAIVNLALALLGKRTGGPALAAVGASAAMGSITGNGAANVAITGAFTIPLMKRLGYPAQFAAATEAAASQGGQILPPIMGAAAFIIAEYTGVPYVRIIGHALGPALLYFAVVGVMVYLQARKMGMSGLPEGMLPKFGRIIRTAWFQFIPLGIIVYLIIQGFSPMMAGYWGIISTVVIGFVQPVKRLGVVGLLSGLERAAQETLPIACACASAGIIVGSVMMTGLGLRFSRLAIDLAGGELLLLLVLLMIASIIVGMGMPTVSAYVVLAILAVPALIRLGVPDLSAHLYIFYFGVISGLTPPVAITAFTAAGIAGSPPMRTAVTSVFIGLGGFIVPYMFIYNPALLGFGTVWEVAQSLVTSLVGCVAFAAALQGYLITRTSWLERLGLLVLAFFMVRHSLATDLLGLAILLAVLLAQVSRHKTNFRAQTQP